MWQETIVPRVGGDQNHHRLWWKGDKRELLQTPEEGDW